MEKRRIDLPEMFIELYKAYPVNEIDSNNIQQSNNIILPPSALQKLLNQKHFGETKDPVLFRILNINLNIFSHCGVSEFTAEEGKCYIPQNLFSTLLLEEGQNVNIRKAQLRKGNYVKLQPYQTEFIIIPNYKSILEYNLRNYFCLTENDTISLKFKNKIYKIDILECRPDKAIRTLNCDLEIDFKEPKDFKEYQKKSGNKNNIMIGANVINLEKNTDNNNLTGSRIIFNSEQIPAKLSEEEKRKKIYEKNFIGHCFALNGKIFNKKGRFRFKNEEKTSNEENYDPRKYRIFSDQKLDFKFVELKFG